jgi:NAD(P)-dependent dehydrogenase (short-subunit alcohol dehydrogenase family)
MSRRVALVTGASRGIGKASALALAERGFDVAITARTRREGEHAEPSLASDGADATPLPGSLETTAGLITERGRDALEIPMDLLDRESVEAAARRVIEAWGRVDVLVNNAVYTGQGSLDHFVDLPLERIETVFQANLFSQIHLTKLLLPTLLEQASGIIVNVTSHVAENDPSAPAGRGGWGFAYAATKGAFHRMAGILAVELEGSGVRAHNLDPGFVVTEAMQRTMDARGFAKLRGAPPAVPAAVIAWLADEPEAAAMNGRTVYAQPFCKERGLVPEWP